MYICHHVEYLLFLSDVNDTWIFSTFFKKAQISNFIKIHSVGVELFHVDRQIWWSWQFLFTSLRTCLKMRLGKQNIHDPYYVNWWLIIMKIFVVALLRCQCFWLKVAKVVNWHTVHSRGGQDWVKKEVISDCLVFCMFKSVTEEED
jgi:hypothetical protein